MVSAIFFNHSYLSAQAARADTKVMHARHRQVLALSPQQPAEFP
jgi:hypothetical protein